MNASDPRLTAHALGEADAESAELIERDAALSAEAGHVRGFAAQLRAELQAEPALALREEQRAAILAAAPVVAGPWWQRGAAIGAAAACAVLALGAAIYFQARHVSQLRPMAEAQSPAPGGVSVRWAGENGHARVEPVVALQGSDAEARPSFPSAAPSLVRAPESPRIPASKPAVSDLPALVTAPSGTQPADPERTSAAPIRPAKTPRR